MGSVTLHPLMWWDTHTGVTIASQEMVANSNDNYVALARLYLHNNTYYVANTII